MSRRERETEPVIGGGSPSGLDGVYTLGGGGSSNGSQPETKGLGFGAGGSQRGNEGGIAKTAWFAPVEGDASPNVIDFGSCKDGICPVPWASNDNPVFTIQGLPTMQEDVVNHPSHYTDGGVETIEAIEAQLSTEEYEGYLRGNCVKYLWRWRHKGGVEDLKKCKWYLDRLISLVDV